MWTQCLGDSPQRWSPGCFWAPAGLRSPPARRTHTPRGWLWTSSLPASCWEQPARGRGSLRTHADRGELQCENQTSTTETGAWRWEGTPTDGGEDVGEAEVVDGVEGEEVVEKLLLLVVAAEESVPFVQFPKGKTQDFQRSVDVINNLDNVNSLTR